MKVSQNQYAETLLKAVGAARGGLGTTDRRAAGRGRDLRRLGDPDRRLRDVGRSGLSRYNYVAPSTITTILARMHSDPRHREAFVATLPIAGKDGTISTRMRRTPRRRATRSRRPARSPTSDRSRVT